MKNKKTTLIIGATAGLLAGTLNTGCEQLTTALINNKVIEQELDDTITNLDEPYTKPLGNGNYFVHNFIGQNTTINKKDIFNSATHYLNKGEFHVHNLSGEFKQSLEDRSDAMEYFRSFISATSSLSFKLYNGNPGNQNIDHMIDYLSAYAQKYIVDLIKNLDNDEQRKAFRIAYRVIALEAYREGLGADIKQLGLEMYKYRAEKSTLIAMAKNNSVYKMHNVNLEIEYINNDFTGTTDILDNLITISVNNMRTNKFNYKLNKTRSPLNVYQSDFHQQINLTLVNNSLEAFHDRVAKDLGHKEQCDLRQGINTAIDIAIEDAFYDEQKRLQTSQEYNK